MNEIILYDYWRSSASYRVRIVLNLKGVAYTAVPTSLLEGDHKSPDYVARNPQGFVPMLSIDGHDLTQSLAIIDYLDANYHDPKMVSGDPAMRAKTLAQAMIIAADIHPINNLRILKYLKDKLGHDQSVIDDWYRHWILEGFTALEAMAPEDGLFGSDLPNLADVCLVPQMANARRFDTPLEAMAPEDGLFGSDLPNLADVCLVPQMANARRFDTPLEAFPKLLRIDAALTEMPAFKAAHPDAVNPDI